MFGLESISKTNPLLAYFFMGQIILFCAALMVGGMLLLKRLIKKQPFEGDPNFDNERIAGEIHQEILKLQDLRNRLYPALATSDSTVVLTVPAPPATVSDGEGVDREAIEKEVAAKFEKMIQALEAELKKAKDGTASAAPAGEAAHVIPDGYLGPDQVKEEIAKALAAASGGVEEFKKKADDSVQQVAHLEKVLSEYRIFEEDFALVKKFKAENEALKRQLEAMDQAGGSEAPQALAATSAVAVEGMGEPAAFVASTTPSPPAPEAAPSALSDDQVKSLLDTNSVKETAEEVKVIAATSKLEETKVVIPADTKQPSDQDLSSLFDNIKKKPAEEGPAVVASAPAAVSPIESMSQNELSKALDEKGSEAAAEAAGADDNLMAEFEKLLSGGEAKS